jgi:hypothetical protein
MPILSKNLTKLANREDLGAGFKKWRIDGKDARGRRYTHGPFGGTQIEAEAVRDSIDWADARREEDYKDALHWVQDGNLLDTFDLSNRDITLEQAEESVFAWFASKPGNEAMTVVWWMEQFNTGDFNAIRNRIGYSGDALSEIPLRVSALFNAIGHYDNTFKRPA